MTKDHTKFIVSWIGIITIFALTFGAILVVIGYNADLVFGIAVSGASSLGTMVAMRRTGQPPNEPNPPNQPNPPNEPNPPNP